MNVVSHFPGGAQDFFILQSSPVGMRLEQGAAGDAWLVGTYLLIIEMWLCFICKSRICPDPLVNNTTDQPSDSPGGFIKTDTCMHSLQSRAHHNAGCVCTRPFSPVLFYGHLCPFTCKLWTAGTSFSFTKRLSFISLRAKMRTIYQSNTFMIESDLELLKEKFILKVISVNEAQ